MAAHLYARLEHVELNHLSPVSPVESQEHAYQQVAEIPQEYHWHLNVVHVQRPGCGCLAALGPPGSLNWLSSLRLDLLLQVPPGELEAEPLFVHGIVVYRTHVNLQSEEVHLAALEAEDLRSKDVLGHRLH